MYGSLERENSTIFEKVESFSSLFVTWLPGIFWIILSALCSGFGNSLESCSPLAWLHTFCLLVGFDKLSNKAGWMICCAFTLLVEAFASTFAFYSVFSADGVSIGETIGQTFGFSLGLWLVLIIFCLLPHQYLSREFNKNVIIIFVYPICFTAVNNVLVGETFGTFQTLGNSVIDYSPLRQFSCILGLGGINFFVTLCGTLFSFNYLDYKFYKIRLINLRFATAFLIIAIISAFIERADNFYQKDINRVIKSTLNVSCIFGQSELNGHIEWDEVWKSTANRIEAKDNIILWSETCLEISSNEEEMMLLDKAKNLLIQTNSSYLGITYLLDDGKNQYNRFSLLSPHGKLLWKYQKAFPVPIIEADVVPGPPVLATHHSPWGKLGGAICFDLDHPFYLRQAGVEDVDILLQPSWTWGAIGIRHFSGNALRAIENGFTLFRCSSDGVSGIVSPRGVVWAQAYTGHDPTIPTTFSLPIWSHIKTFYSSVGFVFDWLCVVAAGFIFIFILIPDRFKVMILLPKESPLSENIAVNADTDTL